MIFSSKKNKMEFSFEKNKKLKNALTELITTDLDKINHCLI